MVTQVETYKNGVRLAVTEMPHLESVALSIHVGVGGRHEKPEESGLSHFVEHMLHQGTGKHTKEELATQFRALGGITNAQTNAHRTLYWISTAADFFPKAFDTFMNMMVDSRFSPESVENQRSVIIQESNQSESDPSFLQARATVRMLNPNHPLSSTILGPVENLERFSREQLMQFWKNHYQGENLVVSAAGRVSMNEVKQQMEPFIEGIEPQKKSTFEPAPEAPREHKITVVPFPVSQTSFALTFSDVNGADDRRFASNMALDILNWRLFDDIREKMGLVYSIRASGTRIIDAGHSYILGDIQSSNLVQALAVSLQHMEKLAAKGPDSAELQMCKDTQKISQKMSVDICQAMAEGTGAELLTYGKVTPDSEYCRKSEAVTPRDVRDSIRRMLDHPCRVLTVLGPAPSETDMRRVFEAGAAR